MSRPGTKQRGRWQAVDTARILLDVSSNSCIWTRSCWLHLRYSKGKSGLWLATSSRGLRCNASSVRILLVQLLWQTSSTVVGSQSTSTESATDRARIFSCHLLSHSRKLGSCRLPREDRRCQHRRLLSQLRSSRANLLWMSWHWGLASPASSLTSSTGATAYGVCGQHCSISLYWVAARSLLWWKGLSVKEEAVGLRRWAESRLPNQTRFWVAPKSLRTHCRTP